MPINSQLYKYSIEKKEMQAKKSILFAYNFIFQNSIVALILFIVFKAPPKISAIKQMI